ncbi:MAG TPA: hypothetical protein VGD73_26290 [Pseudonocardia sp.]|uniref:hypothetical protein n=1 Tax=Pseudonocardia sp. TaxID=60912 RepID=UPI002ED99BCB
MNRLAGLGRDGLVALVLLLGAVAFTGTGVARLVSHGNPEALTLPLALLAADLLIAGALVTRWYAIRPVAQGLAIFGALVHVLVLLRSGPWWIRGWSALLAAAHIYALLLFFALSAREQYDDELDEDDAVDVVRPENVVRPETAAEQPEVRAEEPAEVEIPVARVTEPNQPNQPHGPAESPKPDQPNHTNGRAEQPEPGNPGQPAEQVESAESPEPDQPDEKVESVESVQPADQPNERADEPDQLDEPEPARSAAGGSGTAEGKERMP